MNELTAYCAANGIRLIAGLKNMPVFVIANVKSMNTILVADIATEEIITNFLYMLKDKEKAQSPASESAIMEAV
jgi:hypothetical protein